MSEFETLLGGDLGSVLAAFTLTYVRYYPVDILIPLCGLDHLNFLQWYRHFRDVCQQGWDQFL